MSLSPTCTINGGPTPATVGASATVNGALANPAGATVFFLRAVSADEVTGQAGVDAVNASLSINQTNKTFSFSTASGLGKCIIFQATVGVSVLSTPGNGLDIDGNVVAAWTTTFKVNIPAANGNTVLAVNEVLEQSSYAGWIANINPALRSVGGSGSGITALTGDVQAGPGSGSQVSKVVAIQNTPVSASAPTTAGETLVYDGTTQYVARQLTQDDILAGFAITGFSGGSTVEVGASVVNPAFTASYTATPASASITNTDGTDSPHVLTTPFTSGTVTGTFHKTAQATVTFTLTAVGASTKTATQAVNFFPRSFAGVGNAGASSATASGTTAVLNGGAGTLASVGLFSSLVGQTLGPYAPSSQKIYVLTPHTSSAHTFKDQNGFGFAMNAPSTISFTNQNGAVISMDLYESTNILLTSFSLSVVS